MDLKMFTSADYMWNKVRDYAKSCSWGAGKSLANAMENNLFTEWERVIVALDDQKICGYCTVAKTDCIPEMVLAIRPNGEYDTYIGTEGIVGDGAFDAIVEKIIK